MELATVAVAAEVPAAVTTAKVVSLVCQQQFQQPYNSTPTAAAAAAA